VLRRLIADNYALTALPVDLRANTQSIAIVTLKNRTLSPVGERFLACVRGGAAPVAGNRGGRAGHPANRHVLRAQAGEPCSRRKRPQSLASADLKGIGVS